MFIETHAHLYDEAYLCDIEEVINRAKAAGAVKVLIPPTDEASTKAALTLCRRFPDYCYPMIGLHPEDVKQDYQVALQRIKQILLDDINSGRHEFIAIGEVGLDYYWDKTHKTEQKEAFATQIQWAAQFHLPLMIHSRAANGDLLECLKPYQMQLARGGVFHCFSGSEQEARQLLDFHSNFYLGIGGVLTFKNSRLKEVVKSVPLERIVLETDSPYMAPTPMRGKRNEPSYIPYIINLLAQIKGVQIADVEQQTTANAQKLFFPSSLQQ